MAISASYFVAPSATCGSALASIGSASWQCPVLARLSPRRALNGESALADLETLCARADRVITDAIAKSTASKLAALTRRQALSAHRLRQPGAAQRVEGSL